MGFGWLLFGYFFSSVMALYSELSFAMLLGYPMMIAGLYFLAHYQKEFKVTFYFSFLSLPFAVYFSLYSFAIWGMPAPAIFYPNLFYGVQWGYTLFTAVFPVLWLFSISRMAKSLQLSGIESNAFFAIILHGVYFILKFIGEQNNQKINRFIVLPYLLCFLGTLLFNMYLIYQCYRRICSADEAMVEEKKEEKREEEKKEEKA